jgi:hypothetical protein
MSFFLSLTSAKGLLSLRTSVANAWGAKPAKQVAA